MDRGIIGPLDSPQLSSELEMRALAGLSSLWQWGQSIFHCHESGTLAASYLKQGPGGSLMQLCAQGPVFLHLKQELFPWPSLAFPFSDLCVFKALPCVTAILSFLFCLSSVS